MTKIILKDGRVRLNYTKLSLNQLAYDSRVREFCIWMNEQKWFHNAIITLIILNSIMLGTIDYNFIETEENVHLKPRPNVIAE